MPERLSPDARSANMRAVKGRNTKPELLVRRLLHAAGYRFRLHPSDVPGKPDIAWKGRRKAVFVHGCFWHGHDCRRGRSRPAARAAFWADKIARNQARDVAVAQQLDALGWAALTVWECELRDLPVIADRLKAFVGLPLSAAPIGKSAV